VRSKVRDFVLALGPPAMFGIVSFAVLYYTPLWASFPISLSILGLLYLYYREKSPHIELKNIVGSILTGTFPATSAIAVAILFITYTSWLADLTGSGIELLNKASIEKDYRDLFFGTLTLLTFIFSLPFVFVMSLPESSQGTSGKRQRKKVFIGALSDLRPVGKGADMQAELEEILKIISSETHELDEKLKRVRLNWAPLLRSIFFHTPTLKKIYLLTSEESHRNRDIMEKILNEYKRTTGNSFEVNFSDPIDFNSYDEIHSELIKMIKEIKRDGYTDIDISIYISGGTSAVTLALTLLAVKEGRQVEYLIQTKNPEDSHIISINISLEDIFSFAPELKGMSGS